MAQPTGSKDVIFIVKHLLSCCLIQVAHINQDIFAKTNHQAVDLF
jgi:hypothetical protein